MISVASIGVLGWIVADEPVIATGCVVLADLIGAGLMVPKAYRDPHSETLSTFALASLGGALTVGAVGACTPALLLYPVYFCLVNGALALLLYRRRAVLGAPALGSAMPNIHAPDVEEDERPEGFHVRRARMDISSAPS